MVQASSWPVGVLVFPQASWTVIGDGDGGLAWLSFSFNNKRIVTFWPTLPGGKQRGSYLVVVEEGSLVLVGLVLGAPPA